MTPEIAASLARDARGDVRRQPDRGPGRLATIETIESERLLDNARAIARGSANISSAPCRTPDGARDACDGDDDRCGLGMRGASVVAGCLERKLLINGTHGTVCGLCPP